MNEYLEKKSHEGFMEAKGVYENGAFSRSVARIQLVSELPVRVAKGTQFTGVTSTGQQVSLLAFDNYEEKSTSIELRYVHEGCHVGGLPGPAATDDSTDPGDQQWGGCKYIGEKMIIQDFRESMVLAHIVFPASLSASPLQVSLRTGTLRSYPAK